MIAKSFDVVIVGGGTGGISTAAQLRKADHNLSIAIIEPSVTHYYQPIWTLVGGGVVPKETSARPEASLIPSGCTWIHDSVTAFAPDQNHVETEKHGTISYQYLIVATGMQLRWERVEGLKDALKHPGVCSNYSYDTVDKTWACIRELERGIAIFTFPNTPIKCGGAPQKIMYLAEDYFRRQGIRDRMRIIFVSAGASIFAVKKYADALSNIIAARGIETMFGHNLQKIDAKTRQATFVNLATNTPVTLSYNMIHVTPPMSAPDVVMKSSLANKDGWVEVDKHSLQHVRYPNVFSVGDVSSLPTSRTGAAIRKQTPVLVSNLLAHKHSRVGTKKYDGYTSCPLVTGYGKLILAEFDYDNKPVETFPFDQSKERLSMYLLKKHALPMMYWQGMMRGRM